MAHTPYKTQTNGVGSPQEIYRFPNGYGASVIEGGFARGGRELAVLKFNDSKSGSYELTYDTPITDDTEGWLSEVDVESLLDRIADLPAP